MRKESKPIEIQEDVAIGNGIILEKGDKIRVLVEEKKITKNMFMNLHKSGKLGLVQGMVKNNATGIFSVLNKAGETKVKAIKSMKTSNVSVDSHLQTGTSVAIYSETIFERDFIVVETTCDNSKDSNVSWDTIDTYSVIYVVL